MLPGAQKPGEVGAQDTPMDFETEESFVPPEEWVPDILGVIQDRRLNWTAAARS